MPAGGPARLSMLRRWPPSGRRASKLYRRGVWPMRRVVPVLRGVDLVLAPGEVVGPRLFGAFVWRRPTAGSTVLP